MVNHDHDRVKAIDGGKIGNEVHREVLERVGFLESKEGDGWDHRMGEHLVHLAYYTPGDAWSPVVLGEECDGLQVAIVAALEGAVGGRD